MPRPTKRPPPFWVRDTARRSPLLTLTEVALWVRVSAKTLRRWIAADRFPAAVELPAEPGKTCPLRWLRREVIEWVHSREKNSRKNPAGQEGTARARRGQSGKQPA